MIQFPRYSAERETLEVWNVDDPFPAGSLTAMRLGDKLAVASPVDGALICEWLPFDQWALPDGVTTLPDADSAFAYLDGQCRAHAPRGLVRTVPVVVADAGQSEFVLSPAPNDVNGILLFVNGLVYAAPRSHSYSAQRGVLTWFGGFDLIPDDEVILRYP